jgi:hypothetical protein
MGAHKNIGRKHWAIAEVGIPSWGGGSEPEMLSHETACLFNTSSQDAQVSITISYTDRDPVGLGRVPVPAPRTKHVWLNELKDPVVASFFP